MGGGWIGERRNGIEIIWRGVSSQSQGRVKKPEASMQDVRKRSAAFKRTSRR